MDDTVIKIENLKKKYCLGTIGGGTLSADLQSWWARKRGKEDPNLKIGQSYSNVNEEFWALNGINLEIKKGEAVGIIGSNGAGKSTLLKLLSRVTAPTEGDIYYQGRISSMLEVGTGFHGEMTGRENIYVNGAILGMSKKEVDSKIEDIIEFSECRKFIDTPVKRYSSGMYVKLAFSVAAYLDAEILVMDEVLAVGDVKFQQKCLGKMGNAANLDGKTVLYVSHNMSTVRQLCSRCIVLKQGKVIFDGGVEEGINIYMEKERGTLSKFYDYSLTKRPYLESGTRIFLNSFEFLEKNVPSYTNDENIKFKIGWIIKKKVSNVRLYLLVKSAEDDSIAGLAESENISFEEVNKEGESFFIFDVSNLAEGVYYTYPEIFIMTELGARYSFDHPLEKVYFEVVNNDTSKRIPWQRKYWGNVRLNNIRLLQ